jgi:hypothetical protein
MSLYSAAYLVSAAIVCRGLTAPVEACRQAARLEFDRIAVNSPLSENQSPGGVKVRLPDAANQEARARQTWLASTPTNMTISALF